MKRIFALFALLALAATLAAAQTTTPTGPSFNGATGPCAIRIYGVASTCSATTESLDFYDFGKTKSNLIVVEGQEIVAPTPGLSLYIGDLRYQPDMKKWLAKTNVTPANLSISFNAGGGAGVPATGATRAAFLLGGQIQYKATTALTWNPLQIQWVRYGDANAAVYSTQLSYFFKPKAQ